MSRSRKKRTRRTPNAPDAPIAASAPTIDASFGALLRRARTQRGISLDAMARDTRLARRYLLALENESIDELPGGVYNRAYLRTCALYLGLDADRLVRDYDLHARARTGNDRLAPQLDAVAAMRAVVEQRARQTGGGGNVSRFPARAVLLRGMALVALVGGVWAGARYFRYPSEVVAASSARTAVLAPRVADERQATPMSVAVSGVGTDVVDRQLVGRAETFAAGARVFFWTLVTGGHPGDTVRHVWLHGGRIVAIVNLSVGDSSWPTQSDQLLAPDAQGEWAVEAQDDRGRVLARHTFRSMP